MKHFNHFERTLIRWAIDRFTTYLRVWMPKGQITHISASNIDAYLWA